MKNQRNRMARLVKLAGHRSLRQLGRLLALYRYPVPFATDRPHQIPRL